MGTFFTVWSGQLVSVVGTTITGFGLQIWVYSRTGSVTSFALVALAFGLPATLISPVAGALVDRWDRRLVMVGADTLAGASTLAIAALHFTGNLEIWHIYLLVGFGSVGNAFQMPAWLASLPTLVPKRHLSRANGMTQLVDGVALVLGPAIAGALLFTAGLGAILILDAATFVVAVVTLAVVRFPAVPTPAGTDAGPSLLSRVQQGWRFIRDRSGLMWLLWLYAGVNFVLAFSNVLLLPMILSFSDERMAGAIFSAGGIGLLAGSLVMSAWGGPRRRIAGITWGIAAVGLFLTLAGARPDPLLVGIGVVLLLAVVPLVNTASQVLWQVKVPLHLQGRVFALRRMLAQAVAPVAILLAGPLSDRVFEPLLAEGGPLAGTVGSVIGTGPGRGIALLVILSGLLTALIGILGWLHPRVRNVESELPDTIPDEGAPGRPEPVPGPAAAPG
jgi:MFS family permease